MSEEHFRRRLFLTILFLAIGAAALTYALINFLQPNTGWSEITANAVSDEISCSEDFVFLYELGEGESSAMAENKMVKNLYTETAISAYKIFDTDYTYDDVNNICLINRSPNEIVTVDPELYAALELVSKSRDREIYLGPSYEYYDNIFYCEDDSRIIEFDSYEDADAAAYYAEIEAFALDPEAVDIELLGDDKVRLFVSEEYLAFAEENGIKNFIDFYWMKNAFIIDYLADTLAGYGYTHGCITSYDGFVRNLDDRDVTYSFAIYSRSGDDIYQPAILEYSGEKSIVYLRNYMMSDKDLIHYYELANGQIRTPYLDYDGYCKSAVNDLVAYSDRLSCAEIALRISPLYIADALDGAQLDSLADEGIYFIYTDQGKLIYDEPGLKEVTADGEVYLTK